MNKFVSQESIDGIAAALSKAEKDFEIEFNKFLEVKKAFMEFSGMCELEFGQKTVAPSNGEIAADPVPSDIKTNEHKKPRKKYFKRKDPLLRVLTDGPGTFEDIICRLGLYFKAPVSISDEQSWKACLNTLIDKHVTVRKDEKGDKVYELINKSNVSSS